MSKYTKRLLSDIREEETGGKNAAKRDNKERGNTVGRDNPIQKSRIFRLNERSVGYKPELIMKKNYPKKSY